MGNSFFLSPIYSVGNKARNALGGKILHVGDYEYNLERVYQFGSWVRKTASPNKVIKQERYLNL